MLPTTASRLDAVVRTEAPTTLALAELDDGGSARYRFYDAGHVGAGPDRGRARRAARRASAILHVGTLGLVLEPMASTLEAVVDAPRGRAR